ncbi:Crp/Fnr family transcriptional regulator [Flavobacterium agricola]|uniref:Crp/Fnr family transcriptional regulator n=1 Tax=Flavobacterium agricola TaxID=2870839 RepID=A0ABY6LX12_9FLAO|nr:Crp/Fnr family transcriptional regulator [Flavobacterium agricola]UYW00706.1 Crp/Fnr family transcriptional regulator [Flavobacterium agricola]
MDLLIQNFQKHVDLTEEEQRLILSLVEKESYKARTILLKPGEIANITYFVIEGMIRSYTVDTNGTEHVLSLASPNWFITDMYSLVSRKPAQQYLSVINDAIVYKLSRENQEKLYVQVPKLERFFRILIEKSVVAHQQRLIDNLSLTAEDRYAKFCSKYPDFIQCIPQKYIASYIGVTPEFFSKMKARLLKR